jgi:hypothetical protein
MIPAAAAGATVIVGVAARSREADDGVSFNGGGLNMKRGLIVTLLVLACAGAQAHDSSTSSSQGLGDISASVVAGSIATVSVAGGVVVESVSAIGDGIEVVLRGASNASTATVRLSGAAAGGLSLAAGTAVELVAMSAGYALVVSGKVLTFIPNEAGKALLYHSKVN